MKIIPRHTIACLFLCFGFAGAAPGLFAQSFTDVAVGLVHLCGLNDDGSVDCRTQPHAVRYDSPDNLPPLIAISAGHQHTCGITDASEAVCWGGNNYFNELDIPEITTALVSLDAGVNHTCAIDVGNRVWCWGLNDNNQLQVPGDGLGIDGNGFFKVKANGNASCGLSMSGTIDCWSSDNYISDTSALSGIFTDLDVSESVGCGLRDSGTIQCWASSFSPPDDGPYTDVVVSNTAICGLGLDQQLDCSVNPRVGFQSGDFLTNEQFVSVESGNLYSFEDSNFCGVTVDGRIACIASDGLPEMPGAGTAEQTVAVDIGLNARIYGINSIELFWKPSRSVQPRTVEIYRDDELVETTNANFSWYDSSQQVSDIVKYNVRAVDERGNVGPMSNTVFIDTVNQTITDESLIDGDTTLSSFHPVDRLWVASVSSAIILYWDGNKPGNDGLRGYQVTVNDERVAMTTNTFYTSSQFVDGICNTVSVASVSDDGIVLDSESFRFFRTPSSFGSNC